MQSQIAIIKEFRSPASTDDAFIREVAGGSSHKPGVDPTETAAEEIHEETGLMIDVSRLKPIIARQLFGTLSAHKAHLYSYELNDEELKWLESQKDIPHGVEADTERTFIEIYTIQELLSNNYLDWSNIGMIMSVVCGG